MNAVLRKAKGMSYAQFEKKYGDVYQHETKATYEAIKSGKKDEKAMFFAFNELSDFQPVSLSEMPAQYLNAGNGRILYALKSYNIRALNTITREVFTKYANAKTQEEKIAAGANGLKLITMMVMMGASADELKDWLLNKDAGTFGDTVHENILKTAMLSRYTLGKGFKSDSLKSILADTLLPPTQWVMDPLSDVASMVTDEEPTYKWLKSLPWGKVVYAKMVPGSDRYDKDTLRREIIKEYIDGKSYSAIRSRLNTYNAWARQNEDPDTGKKFKPVTLSTLTRAKQRARKAELKKKMEK